MPQTQLLSDPRCLKKLVTSIHSSLLSVCHYLWHHQSDAPTHFCHISKQMDCNLEESILGLILLPLATSENLEHFTT